MSFSAWDRSQWLKQAAVKMPDLVVIGGGVTGAGIALDAALRGMKVLVVDMQDFAAGSSSRSTKLIHGGLRYLQQGDLKLVREVGRERAIVHRNASHLVRAEPMLIPIRKGSAHNKLAISLALYVYDQLAQVPKTERRTILTPEETLQREPLLARDHLVGAGSYYEYRTDDARLTISLLKTAVEHGARAINYAQVERFQYDQERISGVVIKDLLTEEYYRIRARAVVNASGPWVDHLRALESTKPSKRLLLSKGIHLVFPYAKLPIKQAIYAEGKDGRMIFAVPRGNITYVGTTDTVYTEQQLKEPPMTLEDRHYLLEAVNHIFPKVRLASSDILSGWAGLRPLIYEEGKSPSECSRKDEIFVSTSGLISIAGGKLTGYRKMAERIVDRVAKILYRKTGKVYSSSSTLHTPLSGAVQGTVDDYVRSCIKELPPNISTAVYASWVERYGSHAEQLVQWTEEHAIKAVTSKRPEPSHLALESLAELHYTIYHEMAVTPSDFIIRRTGLVPFNIEHAKQLIHGVSSEMAAMLSWSMKQTEAYRLEAEAAVQRATTFESV